MVAAAEGWAFPVRVSHGEGGCLLAVVLAFSSVAGRSVVTTPCPFTFVL